MLLVGNDILDLRGPGMREKTENARFRRKILTAAEHAEMAAGATPTRILWSQWAAKETAYKIVYKLDGPTVFAYQRFETQVLRITQQPTATFSATLRVRYKSRVIDVDVAGDNDCLHAVGAWRPGVSDASPSRVRAAVARLSTHELSVWRDPGLLDSSFSSAEREAIHQPLSAGVRFHGKRDIAAQLRIDMSRLEIIRPAQAYRTYPPYLMIDGQLADIDLSLSHHGHWIAWAYELPR